MESTKFSGDNCDLEALIKDFDRRFDSTTEDPIAKLGNIIEPILNQLEVNFKKYLDKLKIEQRLCDDCYVKIIDHIHSKISSYQPSKPK